MRDGVLKPTLNQTEGRGACQGHCPAGEIGAGRTIVIIERRLLILLPTQGRRTVNFLSGRQSFKAVEKEVVTVDADYRRETCAHAAPPNAALDHAARQVRHALG